MRFDSDGGPVTASAPSSTLIPDWLSNPMRLSVVCLVAVVALSGCGGSSTDPAVENNERTVGSPAVIARIENSTSCTDLQREWSIALGNSHRIIKDGGNPVVPLAYMAAAQSRKGEIGCYG